MGRENMTGLLTAVVAALLIIPGCASGHESDSPSPDSPQIRDDSARLTISPDHVQQVRILRLEPSSTRVTPGSPVWLTCIATAPEGDLVTYEWGATGGRFSTTAGQVMTWIAPDTTGQWTVTATARNSSGHVATESVVITVAENRPPVISSLNASDNPVPMGESITLTCAVSDPDGDPITYSWRATGGELSGVGPVVTWLAPRVPPGQATEYLLTVVVEDDSGAMDLQDLVLNTVRVVVLPDDAFTPVSWESGTVRSDGTILEDMARAGDDEENRGYRSFWSYDLSPLRGTSIAQATLNFKTGFIAASHDLDPHGYVEGEPQYRLWTKLHGLNVYQVEYESGGLPDYDPQRVRELTQSTLFEAPTQIDVTDVVRALAATAAENGRFQVMVAFSIDTNPNMFAEYISWSTVTLDVMYE